MIPDWSTRKHQKGFFWIILYGLALLGVAWLSATREPTTAQSAVVHTDEEEERLVSGISVPSLPEPPQRCAGIQELTDQHLAVRLGIPVEKVARLKQSKNISTEQICTMSSYKLARALTKIDKSKRFDKPNEWARLRAMQQASDNHLVKPDGYIRASEQRSAILFDQETNLGKIWDTTWTSIGPGNIGGRTRSIIVHPTDTDTMWTGGVAGGIWKTTDGGKKWSPANDFMGNLAVSTMTIDPKDPRTLYAGTGESFTGSHPLRGYGIFKSTDGGTTWKHLPSTDPTNNKDWYYVNRLAMSSKRVLLAATGDETESGGIYRSIDGGVSWTKVWETSQVLQVLFDPKNSDTVTGTTFICKKKDKANDCVKWNSVIIRSTNGGSDWKSVSENPTGKGKAGRIELAFAPSNPSIIYASFDDTPDSDSGAILKSTDNGANWTVLNNRPQHLQTQGGYDNTIWVSPKDPNLVVIGGIDLHRSTDGGKTWKKISDWSAWPKSAHADHHAIVHHPLFNGTTNKTVFFGTDGGIFKVKDISAVDEKTGWESLNNSLGITQFYGGAGTEKFGKIIGGTQDNGHLMWSNKVKGKITTNWKQTESGDGGFAAVDPEDEKYMYGEYTNLALYRSKDEGKTYKYICKGITEGLQKDKETENCDGTGEALFIAPFILDPNQPTTLLAGASSLWRSVDVKAEIPVWTSIKQPINKKCYTNSMGCISAIAVAPGYSDIIWVGHQGGEVFYTENGQAANNIKWTRIKTLIPKRYVHRIMIDKDDNNKVYVTFGGFNKDNLYVTTDRGKSWKSIHSTLPDAPIRTIVRHPTKPDWLYVGTDVGIFASEDGGKSWSTKNIGPANVSVDELFWYSDQKLVAATHGRGMFMATDPLN